MNHRIGQSIFLSAVLVAAGCGQSSESTSPTPGPLASASNTNDAKTGFKFSTGKFEIQPGDTFECFYTDTITDRQLNIQDATGTQGPGGHHITVYYTDQKVPVGHHPCNDVEMLGLHQIAAAAGGNEGIIALPPGYATKVPAGKQIVVQTHYVRTEPGPQTVEDVITLKTIEDAAVKAYANSFVLVDTKFNLTARSTGSSTTECIVPRDFDVLLMLGHEHEWGSHFKLDQVDEAGKTLKTLYETDWEPLFMSHPPINNYGAEKPLKLTKGMRLRQTCEWKNSEDHEMTFPREMCVTFAYYIPDDGFIECDMRAVKK